MRRDAGASTARCSGQTSQRAGSSQGTLSASALAAVRARQRLGTHQPDVLGRAALARVDSAVHAQPLSLLGAGGVGGERRER